MRYKQGRITAGSVILLVYLLSSFFSIVYINLGIQNRFDETDLNNLRPTIVYLFLITSVIVPIYGFKDNQIQKVILPKNKEDIYVLISWTLIAFTVISIVLSASSFLGLLGKDLGAVRQEFYDDVTSISYTRSSQSIFYYIINMGTILSPILLLFFFYGCIYMPWKKGLNISLLIASLSNVLFSLLQASRTETVYWLLTYFVYYATFHSQMNARMQRIFRTTMIIIGAVAVSYIVFVAVSRFGSTKSYNNWSTGYSFIVYMGLPYPEFCTLFNMYFSHEPTFDRTFPIFTKYILGNNFNLYEYRIFMSNSIGMPIGTFYTFLGDAMVDFGKLGMCIYTAIIVLFEKIALRRLYSASVTLSQMIVYALVIRVPLLGVFAYVYKSVSTSLLIVGALLIAIILSDRFSIIKRNKM